MAQRKKSTSKKYTSKKTSSKKPAANHPSKKNIPAKPALPVAERRGISKHLTGGWTALLIHASSGIGDADALLDVMLDAGWIGGARRDVATDLLNGRLQRPMGPWGLIVQLVGHPWLYLLGDNLRYEWAKELAAKLDRRAALFEFSGMHGTLYARAYESQTTLFDFECGGFFTAGDDRSVVRPPKERLDMAIDGTLFDTDWLRQFKSGSAAQDALAREMGLYLPVLYHSADKGQAKLVGRETANFKPVDYARIDLFVFGDASTLETLPAVIALGKAVRAGQGAGVQAALADGADVRYLPDDDDSPLTVALALGAGGTYDWKYKRISREQQLAVLAALLEAGADPNPSGLEPAIHQVLHWGDGCDERTIIRQLRLLLDHGADPNALGTFFRGDGQRPLHVAVYQGWLAVMKLLVSRGADATLTNRAGKTPREAAQARLEQLKPSGTTTAGVDNAPRSGAMAELIAIEAKVARSAIARLQAAMDFLAAAERGTADTADIDKIAEASWRVWIEEHERWKAERKAKDPKLWRELHGED